MIPLAGGLREASLILTAGGASGDVAMFGDGHFAPQLIASPAAITTDGFTTVIGLGFPPNQTFDIHLDPTGPCSPRPPTRRASSRSRSARSASSASATTCSASTPYPTCSTSCTANSSSYSPTFEPQGPGGAAFGEALIVTRGS